MHRQSLRLLDTDEGASFRFTLETAEAPGRPEAEDPGEPLTET